MRGRVYLAAGILAAWFGGLGVLVKREYFRPQIERLAQAALRVTPSAMFYAVMQGNRQVGFASSTVDTATSTIEQRDYLVADLPLASGTRRAEIRSTVTLTRTLRVKSFDVEMDTGEPLRVTGEVVGDSVIRAAVTRGNSTRADSQVIRTAGAILLPSLVPLAVALGEKPKVGNSATLPVFEPAALATRELRVDVRAESLFVVNDSSVFDSTTGRWKEALPDTVRGWQLVSQGGTGVGGWVDEQGRVIASTQLGFQLQRRPYEVAFENWKLDSDTGARRVVAAGAPANRNVSASSLAAAGVRPGPPLSELRVRIRGSGLSQLNVAGGRQLLIADTLVVRTEDVSALAPRYIALRDARERARNASLRQEPFLEVDHPEIQAAAERIGSFNRNPRNLAQKLFAWVRDSLQEEPSSGIPSALHVLHTRHGDANEHAQLYVALARAAGIPAHVASGLLYADGKFYYHAWPEIMLRGWVAVDPMLGQFPADAGHLRLLTGGVARQDDVLRVLDHLQLDVISKR